MYELLDFMLGYVLDLRDRTRMSFDRAQHRSGNWQTDMCIGASMIMFAFKDLPYRENWIDNAYTIVYGQMNANLNKDGSWPESHQVPPCSFEQIDGLCKSVEKKCGSRLVQRYGFIEDV